jgi:hypothetical protein
VAARTGWEPLAPEPVTVSRMRAAARRS